jgi:DNA-binding transcriptional ArsR family regulator
MNELEKILKALANRRRLAILKHLKMRQGDNVGCIAREIGLSLVSTSKHLIILARCGILEKEQRSLEVFYRLAETQKVPAEHIIALL